MAALVIPTYWKAIDEVSPAMAAMRKSTMSYAQKTNAAFQIADRAINKHLSVLSHAQKELLQTFSATAIAYKGIQAIEYGFDAVKDYDEQVTKLQTNFRLSDAAMIPFKQQIISVADEMHKAASETSDVFNIIGSKNRDLVSQPGAIAAMAKSSITLSEALKTDLIPTAESFTAVMKGFGETDSKKAADMIAAISTSGNVQGLALTESLREVSQEARHANISLTQTGAMIEYIDSKAQDGGTSARAFIRELLKLEQTPGLAYRNAQGKFDITSAIVGMRKQLDKMSPQAQEAYLKGKGITGARAVAVGRAIMAPNAIQEIAKYAEQANKVGIAEEMAAKNTGTLAVAMERVKAAFGNAFIASDIVGSGMNHLKNILVFVYKNMDSILSVSIKLIEAFAIWKGIVLASAIYTGAYNIAIGIMGATTLATNVAIGQSALALRAYSIASAFATINTEEMTLAMDANPIILLVSAIGLLGVGLYAAFKNSEDLNDSLDKRKKAALDPALTAREEAEKKAYDKYDKAKGNIQGATSSPEQIAARAQYTADMATIKEAYVGNVTSNLEKSLPAFNSKITQQNSIEYNGSQMQRVGIDINTTFGLNATVTDNKNSIPVTTTTTYANGFK